MLSARGDHDGQTGHAAEKCAIVQHDNSGRAHASGERTNDSRWRYSLLVQVADVSLEQQAANLIPVYACQCTQRHAE